LASVEALNTIFSELPILFFLSVYSVIVIRWAEIYHYAMEAAQEGKLRPVVFSLNGLMYVFFIVVMILYFVLYNNPTSVNVNCANVNSVSAQLNQITPAQILSLVYKSFFIACCLAMAGAFAFYGGRITSRLKSSSSALSSEGQSRRLRKLLIASAVCTIALVLDAANLLLGTFDSQIGRPPWAIMLCVYIIEIAPSGLILSMFKKDSSFTSKLKSKLSTSLSTKRRSMFRSGTGSTGMDSGKDSKNTQNTQQRESSEGGEKMVSLKSQKSANSVTASTDAT